jgi:dihydrofolate reductase
MMSTLTKQGVVALKMDPMPKISIYIATSIDGFIAREDGSLDWLESVGDPHEDYGFKRFIDSIDGVILGRKTYEVAAPVQEWPYTGKRLIILSNTLKTVREGAELYSGSLPQLISKLHDEGVKHIWIDGGETIAQFLQLKLVNEMTLSIIPIILGRGIALFKNLKEELPCQLLSTNSFPSGLVQVTYSIIN